MTPRRRRAKDPNEPIAPVPAADDHPAGNRIGSRQRRGPGRGARLAEDLADDLADEIAGAVLHPHELDPLSPLAPAPPFPRSPDPDTLGSESADDPGVPVTLDVDALLSGEERADDQPACGRSSAAMPADAAVAEPAVTVPAPRWSTATETRARADALIAELPDSDPRRAAARDELVTMHLPLAGFLARRFRDRGEIMDDLTQVATIGLIKAVDRFDPNRGVEFSTFATPTIVGEIKRHFRDKGWAIRVPRRLQELRIAIGRATAELSQTTGRSPTVAELADLPGRQPRTRSWRDSSPPRPTRPCRWTPPPRTARRRGPPWPTPSGDHDPGLGEVEVRETLHPLMATLPPASGGSCRCGSTRT